MDHCTILNILLDNLEQLDLKHKSALREDKIFTLYQRVIPIASAELDDNGAYISKGNAKRFYQYSITHTSHSENGAFFANIKASKGYKKDYVPNEEVYRLTTYYRMKKAKSHFQGPLSQLKQSKNEDRSLSIWSCISGQVDPKSLSCSVMVMPWNLWCQLSGKTPYFVRQLTST